jgi:hypothetical protein
MMQIETSYKFMFILDKTFNNISNEISHHIQK